MLIINQLDAVNENQVWKTKVDLQIFQDLMSECNNKSNIASEYKKRYIKFIKNSEKCSSSDVEHSEEGDEGATTEISATGGNAESAEKNEDSIEQIFLETTV